MKVVYLAGGMKDSWQDRVIAGAPNREFKDPRTHGLSDEAAYTDWDLRAIKASSLVLAFMNSENPSGFGLSLEVGYATALGIPVWYVCEDDTPRQRFFGMVRAVATRRFTALDEAIAELAKA